MPADSTTVIEPEVMTNGSVPSGAKTLTINPVQFNIGTTLRSPFFWLVAGVVLGVWLCKSRKV